MGVRTLGVGRTGSDQLLGYASSTVISVRGDSPAPVIQHGRDSGLKHRPVWVRIPPGAPNLLLSHQRHKITAGSLIFLGSPDQHIRRAVPSGALVAAGAPEHVVGASVAGAAPGASGALWVRPAV